MPWRECHVMDERLRFVARLLEGEKMAPLCAEFGISRSDQDGYSLLSKLTGDLEANAFVRAGNQCNFSFVVQ